MWDNIHRLQGLEPGYIFEVVAGVGKISGGGLFGGHCQSLQERVNSAGPRCSNPAISKVFHGPWSGL